LATIFRTRNMMKYLPLKSRSSLVRKWALAAGAASAALGGLAIWVANKAREAEDASPPRGKILTADGVRVHYLERGEGPPVVLLHGNMLRAEDFLASGLVGDLAKNHRVIALDRPGYGYSERPSGRLWTAEAQAALVKRTLDQLGVKNPKVVGHSWGTLVALELALLPEAAVDRLVLISGYYFPTARGDVVLAAPPAIPLLGDILRYTVSSLMARMTLNKTVKAMFAPQPVPANFLSLLDREMLVRPTQLQADAQDAVFMIPGAARLRKLYRDIKAPVVIVAGEDDRVVDVDAQARKLHEEISGSGLTVLPGVGHMAHYAAPDQIVAAVNQLLPSASQGE
jgi:pimeloyl-ACP methyl ester carboxylesterase